MEIFHYFCDVFRKRHGIFSSTFSVELAPRNEIIRANLFTRSMRPYSADFPFVNRGSARPDRENGDGLRFLRTLSVRMHIELITYQL